MVSVDVKHHVYLLTYLHTLVLPFSPSLLSLMVSVDVKHHVYLLTYLLVVLAGSHSASGCLEVRTAPLAVYTTAQNHVSAICGQLQSNITGRPFGFQSAGSSNCQHGWDFLLFIPVKAKRRWCQSERIVNWS